MVAPSAEPPGPAPLQLAQELLANLQQRTKPLISEDFVEQYGNGEVDTSTLALVVAEPPPPPPPPPTSTPDATVTTPGDGGDGVDATPIGATPEPTTLPPLTVTPIIPGGSLPLSPPPPPMATEDPNNPDTSEQGGEVGTPPAPPQAPGADEPPPTRLFNSWWVVTLLVLAPTLVAVLVIAAVVRSCWKKDTSVSNMEQNAELREPLDSGMATADSANAAPRPVPDQPEPVSRSSALLSPTIRRGSTWQAAGEEPLSVDYCGVTRRPEDNPAYTSSRAPRRPSEMVGAVRGPPRPMARTRGSLVGSTAGGLALTAPLAGVARSSTVSTMGRESQLQPTRGTAAGYRPPQQDRFSSMPLPSAAARSPSIARLSQRPAAGATGARNARDSWMERGSGSREQLAARSSAVRRGTSGPQQGQETMVPLRQRFASSSSTVEPGIGDDGGAFPEPPLSPAGRVHHAPGSRRPASLFLAGSSGQQSAASEAKRSRNASMPPSHRR